MASTVKITRAGIICADPNCGKELPVGSEAKLYHSRTGRQFYGISGCHEKKKLTSEEIKANKVRQMEYLKAQDRKELLAVVAQVEMTNEEELKAAIWHSMHKANKDDIELVEKIIDLVKAHPNKRLWEYSWQQIVQEALTVNQPSVEDQLNEEFAAGVQDECVEDQINREFTEEQE